MAQTTDFYFSQLWRLEVQDQGVSKSSVWWEASSWLADSQLLPVSSLHRLHRERKQTYLCLFIRAPIPFRRAPFSWPNYLPKTPYPNTITLGVRISTYEFRAYTNIQSIAYVERNEKKYAQRVLCPGPWVDHIVPAKSFWCRQQQRDVPDPNKRGRYRSICQMRYAKRKKSLLWK